MKKRNLLAAGLVLPAVLPTVAAAAEFAAKAGGTDLDHIWTLIVGTLIFFLKSKKVF